MIRHLTLLLPTFVGATLIVFLAVRLLPGDVVDQILSNSPEASRGSEEAQQAYREALEERYSLDRNLPMQYAQWFSRMLRGDLGESIISKRPILPEVGKRLIPTIQLSILTLLIGVTIAVPIGVLSALKRNTFLDWFARSMSIVFLSIPTFGMAVLFLVYAFDWFRWSPPLNYHHIWEDPVANLSIMLPPAIIMGVNLAAPTMRLVRSAMLETLRQDYIRTARAKGLRETTVVIRHALRNAMLPTVTVIGLQVPIVLSGLVILERIFAIPGIGRYMLSATQIRDYPAMQAIVVVMAATVILTNFIVERAYFMLDPRINKE